MKKLTLVYLILIMLSCASGVMASQLEDDIVESMYFRANAYVEKDPKYAEFKEGMKKRERTFDQKLREEKLKTHWIGKTNAENEDFKDVKEDMKTIVRGQTSKDDLIEIIKKPQEVMDPSRPWMVLEWRMQQFLRSGQYPAPADAQKVIAGKYYFTETNLPRMGVRMDVLATVNQNTDLVDCDRYFMDTGYIQKYWLVD